MTKQELITFISYETGKTAKEAENFINTLFDKLKADLLEGKEVNITGFGKFMVRETAARTGVNPQTRERIQIPAKKAIKFKVSPKLNETLNEK